MASLQSLPPNPSDIRGSGSNGVGKKGDEKYPAPGPAEFMKTW